MTNKLYSRFAVIAASSGDSIENTAKLLKNVPTANDIRYHLKKINNFEELEAQINQALKSRIPLFIFEPGKTHFLSTHVYKIGAIPTPIRTQYKGKEKIRAGCSKRIKLEAQFE